MSDAYTRGTKTVRANTASLVAGDKVLATEWGYAAADDGRLFPATAKTDAMVKTVAGKSAVLVGGRRAQRRYTVEFTDGTTAPNLAPIQSWHKIAEEVK